MTLEFTINTDMFLAMGGLYLVFFLVLWGIAHTMKFVRG